MKKQYVINLLFALFALFALSPVVYLLIVWDSIPESFVTKFEFNSTFEKVQGKDELMMATIVVSITAVLIFLLMRNLQKVDPKVNDSTPKSTFNKLGALLLIFLTCWNVGSTFFANYFFCKTFYNEKKV